MTDKIEGKLSCVGCDHAPEFAASGPDAEKFAVRAFKDMGWQEHEGHWWCPQCAASPVRRVRLQRSAL